MKLVAHIGPDTLGFTNYKSKDALQKAIVKKAKTSTIKRKDHVCIEFHGRKYCKEEMEDAVVMTYPEYFQALETRYTQ